MEPSDEERKTHQADLFEKLNRDRLEAKLTCDLTLKSEGKTISVHKSILMVSSEFFKNMFTVEMMERYSDGIEVQIPHQRLVNIIDFIYTGRIEITKENVMDVLDDAEYTQILALKGLCSKFLVKAAASVQNCLRIRAYAQRYHLNVVLQKCNRVITSNFNWVMRLADLMELDMEDFCVVLKLRSCAHDEEAAFEAIVKWVKHNFAKRERLFVDLFSLLNLDTLNQESLSTLSQERLVKESLVCSNMLVSAFVNLNASEKILIIGSGDSGRDCRLFDFKTRASEKVASLLNKRKSATSLKARKHVYSLGGAEKSCEALNLQTMDTWNEIANMLEERTWCDSAYLNDAIFVTGGWNFHNEVLSNCEVYDIHENMWFFIPNMLKKRYFHKSIVCQGVLYSIGGFDGKYHLDSCERYDETKKCWENVASLIEARSSFACVEVSGTIYVIGGNNESVLETVEKYVPETNKWESVAPLLSPRSGCFACVVKGKILVIGGRDMAGELRTVEVYNSKENVWELFYERFRPISCSSIVAL